MAEQLLTTQLIANTTLAQIVNNNDILKIRSQKYQSYFDQKNMKYGETVSLRRINPQTAKTGQIASPTNIGDIQEPLTVNRNIHWETVVNSNVWDLKINQFSELYLNEGIDAISNEFSTQVARDATLANYFTGSANSTINSQSQLDKAFTNLGLQGIQRINMHAAMSMIDASNLRSSLANQFNTGINTPILKEAFLGRLAGMNIYEMQNIYQQVAALPSTTAGVTVLNTVQGENITTITLTGLPATTLAFNYGDKFRIKKADGSYIKNLNLKSKVITTPAGFAAGGEVTFTPTGEPIYPSYTSDGAGQVIVTLGDAIWTQGNRANIEVIPAGSTVEFIGSYTANIIYPQSALDIVVVKQEKVPSKDSAYATDPNTGISVRVIYDFDTINNTRLIRVDLECGWKWHYQYMANLISQYGQSL